VTSEEWATADLGTVLLTAVGVPVSARRLRLALCACLRSPALWPLLTSEGSRRAMEVAEAFADGGASPTELSLAYRGADVACSPSPDWPHEWAGALAPLVCYEDRSLCRYVRPLFVSWLGLAQVTISADLLRDIFGDPFLPMTINPSFVTPTITSLALAAYDDRDLPSGTLRNDRLAVLADALEDEAGCSDAQLLEHLRRPGAVHVRGCAAVDAVLGRS
jgi:hypothetical protein